MEEIYEEKLRDYITRQGIAAVHLRFDTSCHSVADAMQTTGAAAESIVKNVCMIGAADELIVAVVLGLDRASTTRVASVLGGERPRIATPEEILERTGYPAGGTPSFGYPAIVLVDPRVMEQPLVYTGGGSARALVRLSTHELLRAGAGRVARVRK